MRRLLAILGVTLGILAGATQFHERTEHTPRANPQTLVANTPPAGIR